MKSNSPESAILRSDAGGPDRTRRTLAEATTQLGQVVGEVITGSIEALGGRRQDGGGRAPAGNAASTSHRLREIIERDRALVAQQHSAEVASARAEQQRRQLERDRAEAQRRAEAARIAARATTQQASRKPDADAQRKATRDAKSRAPMRVPPPPPPTRAATVVSCPLEDPDDDVELSVHDEPTRVGPPPALGGEQPSAVSASAAAAATAFGSSESPATSAPERVDQEKRLSSRETEPKVRVSERARSNSHEVQPARQDARAGAKPPGTAKGASAAIAGAARAGEPAQSDREDETLLPREPIRTLTMARLLASQGHLRRALSIYDELVAKSPHDTALHAEVVALRALKD